MSDEVTPATRKEYKTKKKWIKNEKSKNIATAVALLAVVTSILGYSLHKPANYNGLIPELNTNNITTPPVDDNNEVAQSSPSDSSSKPSTPDKSNSNKSTSNSSKNNTPTTSSKSSSSSKSNGGAILKTNGEAGKSQPSTSSTSKASKSMSTTVHHSSTPSKTSVKSTPSKSSVKPSKSSKPTVVTKPTATVTTESNIVLDDNYVADAKKISRSTFTLTPPSNYTFRSPVTTTTVSTPYGYNNKHKFHSGIDYKVNCGSNVYASADGVVENIGVVDGYGKRIVIKHANNVYTTYSQLYEIKVNVGDKVKVGETIGATGISGSATTCELHFETAINNNFINPLNYINHKVTGEQSIIKVDSIFYGPNYTAPSTATATSKD